MLTVLEIMIGVIFGAGLAIVIARMAFSIPAFRNAASVARPPAAHGALADALAHQTAAHPGLTGIAPLHNGGDAFAARIILADRAVSSIDAQYYIWHGDLTGTLLLDALKRAADRGVKVRVLLDDNGTAGLDAEIAALDAHPMIEVRLWNPFNLRRFKMLSYGFDFFRLNRRMHNKSFIVDGRAAILGGRNVGDEYFGTGATALYVDLDVLAVGAVVPEVVSDFDRYWGADAVRPARLIIGDPGSGDPVAERLASFRDTAQMAQYRAILKASDIVTSLATGSLGLEWTRAVLVSDDPVKGLGAVPRKDLLTTHLKQAVGDVSTRFDGVSPYFVPSIAGVRAFRALVAQGVTVRMLTNSLAATDVLAVHAGYSKRRKAMLRAGVILYEMRRQAAPDAPADRAGPFGSSGASLHAKTFAVDTHRLFVGSFNFDPRSTTINTEMGLLIESRSMAGALGKSFDDGLRGAAWKVEIRDGHLVWIDPESGTERRDEPGSTPLRRLALSVIGWLPVEWLL